MNYNNHKHSNIFSIFRNDRKLFIDDILKGKYTDIYDSMTEENFPLNVEKCDIFNEIKYSGKVVGFATYNLKNDSHVILTQIYVLPSFRGKGLFKNELDYLFEEGYVVSIHEPNKKIVELLIDYGYAEKINKSLVLSAINFSVDKKDLISKDMPSKNPKFEMIYTNFYDLKICASILFRIDNNESYEVYYTDISVYDKNVSSIEVRKELDDEYFIDTVNILTRRDLEVERRLLLLRNNLPSENIEIKELFASDEFSDIFMDYVNRGKVSLDEIKRIKQQLFIDLTRGIIRKESIPLRLDYLVSNYHNNNEKDENVRNPCPYCNEELDYSQRYCVSCGYDIFNDLNIKNVKYFLYKDVLKEKLSFKYSISNVLEKKDEFSEEYLKIMAICYIIDNLNIRNYQEIFYLASDIFGLKDYDLRSLMEEHDYISYDVIESDWFEEAQEFTVSELKDFLLKNNIKQSGNKNDLIKRIKLNIPLDKIDSKVPKVTELGYQFKKDSFPLLYHNKYLKNYVYEEFKDFYERSDKTDIIEITIDFLSNHIQKAFHSKNHNQLIDSIQLQSQLYSEMGDVEEVLRLELKTFLINVNMLFVDEVYYEYYTPITKESYDTIRHLRNGYDFEEMVFLLNLIYDEYDGNDLNISLDESVDILSRLLTQNNLSSLNNRIKYNHYTTELGNDSIIYERGTKISTFKRYF